MRLEILGDISELTDGLTVLATELGVEIGIGGVPVSVVKTNENQIEVTKSGESASIRYCERIHFFRAFGLLVEALQTGDKEFQITETPQFSMNGPMIDVSQGNAVLKVDTVKALLRKMALMGLNMFMLYAEDSYEVDGQPFFGYMRGRYSQAEIRQIDDYADQFGIELIPCIQTLSHLKDVLKWNVFEDIRDDDETMLVGYEQTYEFVEQLIVSASAPVRTKRIHIGMDEAWHLGLGRYLVENGYRSKFDIMNEHLHRVLEITEKNGLKPMMWSDMYFRAGSKTGAYYDKDVHIPQYVIDEMPRNVQHIYWDYYHEDENFYVEWIRKHKSFGSTPIFAGGIWNWRAFALNYGKTVASTHAALSACKKQGVKEIIATLWGDDGTECDIHAAILGLQLFAEHGYARDVDEAKVAKRFRFCTGANYQDFYDISYLDETPGVPEGNYNYMNPSRYLLWQNVLMGLFDKNIQGLQLNAYYAQMENRMAECANRNGDYAPVFEFYRRLASVLSLKAEVGIQVADAYATRDSLALQQFAEETLPEIALRVRNLRDLHRKRWHVLYQPFGWEVIDHRYGGLLMGLETASDRLRDFLDGTIDHLEELDQERLLFQNTPGIVNCYYAGRAASASRLVWYEG